MAWQSKKDFKYGFLTPNLHSSFVLHLLLGIYPWVCLNRGCKCALKYCPVLHSALACAWCFKHVCLAYLGVLEGFRIVICVTAVSKPWPDVCFIFPNPAAAFQQGKIPPTPFPGAPPPGGSLLPHPNISTSCSNTYHHHIKTFLKSLSSCFGNVSQVEKGN